MNKKKYEEECARQLRNQEIYRLRVVEGLAVPSIMQETGLGRNVIYKALSIFERENPTQSMLMKRQGKDVTPEDYRNLLKEIAELKKELTQERLRADFYEEMVSYGKEVYGIDLKKAGTK